MASGRNFLIVAGAMFLIGALITLLALIVSWVGAINGWVIYFIALVLWQAVAGVLFIKFSNVIEKARLMMILAILSVVPLIVEIGIIFVYELNAMPIHAIIILMQPMVAIFGALRNRDEQKDMELGIRLEAERQQEMQEHQDGSKEG
ncbi:MAG: hypothetical protein FWE34_03985 [Defluviitaleaceae bacterium]|nr:hypothetical protein [Defluviitaleaceae bacterium]